MKVLRHVFTYFISNFCFFPFWFCGQSWQLSHGDTFLATCQDTCFLLGPPIWNLSHTHSRICNLLIWSQIRKAQATFLEIPYFHILSPSPPPPTNSTQREMFLLFLGFLMKEGIGGKIFNNSKSVKNFQRGGRTCFESKLKPSSVLNALHSSGLVFSFWLLKFCYLSSLIPLGVWQLTRETMFFKRNTETRAFPWEYGLAFSR